MAKISNEWSAVADTIESALLKAYDTFHKVAINALEVQIANGNNVYSVTVDGKPASGKDQVYKAKSSVRFNFPLRAIELALSIMKSALQTEIGTRANDTGAMRGSVRVWYGGIGKPPREVTGVSEIDNFEQGDYVMLVPDIDYFAFSNSRVADKTGKGFMARAGVRIRRALKINKKTAGLSIAVGRSKAVASKMDIPPNTSGIQRKRIHPARKIPPTSVVGVPVLYIRWKVNQYKLLGA